MTVCRSLRCSGGSPSDRDAASAGDEAAGHEPLEHIDRARMAVSVTRVVAEPGESGEHGVQEVFERTRIDIAGELAAIRGLADETVQRIAIGGSERSEERPQLRVAARLSPDA